MTEVQVRAVFEHTTQDAIERMRQVLPDSNADIRTDGHRVTVVAHYDDRLYGPAVLPEGAQVVLCQVLQAGEIAGLGTVLDHAVDVRTT
jgi:transcriptional regulator of acetoin/glycerol metabolism